MASVPAIAPTTIPASSPELNPGVLIGLSGGTAAVVETWILEAVVDGAGVIVVLGLAAARG
jgi:hypothetical protein